jgi:hypothetical protein
MSPSEIAGKEFNLTTIDYDENPDWRNSDFWIKVKLRNDSRTERWLLEIPDFHIQYIAFYDPYTDSLHSAGYHENFGKRIYYHKNFIYDLNIPRGEERTFLVKMASTRGFGTFMKVYSHPVFVSYATIEYILLGFFYGFLILNAMYNIFMYMSIKDKSHIFYFFYVIAIGMRSLHNDGLGFQFLWSNSPGFNSVLAFISPLLLLFTFVLYSTAFLEMTNQYFRYLKYVISSVGLYILLYIINTVYPFTFYTELVFVLPFLVIYIVSILIYREGYKPARFFVLGYSLLIISLVISFMRSVGLLNTQNNLFIVLNVYSFNIGFAVEAFVFSLSLADKIKYLKLEKEKTQEEIINQYKINEELKDKVNRELELKVAERTKDLEQQSRLLMEANRKLEEQKEQINKMNQMLDIENYKLKSSIQDINTARGLLKALSFEEFTATFPNESACYRFIEDLKWGNGYECRKCGNKKFVKGTNVFAKKCSKCTYNESIKANTIFHDIKFPIEKAFQIIYLTMMYEGKVSTYELANKLQLRQKTCWAFRKRIFEKISKEKISNKDIHEKGWSILICDVKDDRLLL